MSRRWPRSCELGRRLEVLMEEGAEASLSDVVAEVFQVLGSDLPV